MSTISTRPERPAAAPVDPDASSPVTVTPTLTHYQKLADDFVVALDNIIAALPKLDTSHPTTAGFVRGHSNIPIPFMETAVAGIFKNAELQAVPNLNAERGRDVLQRYQAFRPVYDTVIHFAEDLKFTLDAGLAILGADALQVYCLAKGFGRSPDAAHMLQLAEDLKRDLGQRGPKKGAKKKGVPGAPVTNSPSKT